MPTILPRDAANQVQTVSTQPAARPAPVQSTAPSNIVQDAPGATVEGTPAPTPKAPSQDDRMALLARKERALRQQAKDLAAKQAEWEAKQSVAPKAVFDPKGFKDAFMRDPIALGLTPEELQQVTLNMLGQSPEATRIRQLESKIAELEGSVTSSQKAAEDRQTQDYQRAIKQIETEVNTLVDSSDAYEVTKAQGRQKSVVQLIERTYKEEGILLRPEEAAQMVEDHLLEQALSLSKLGKVQAKLLPASPPASAQPQANASQPHASPQGAPQQTHQQTLTRDMSPSSSRTITAKERRERAILAMQGKLVG
jgi:hypothetical protein